MFTLPIPRRVRTWLIRIKGVARLEHNPTVDASELWNRTATPETLAKLAGMALKLANVPDCPYADMKPGTSRTAQNAACNGRLHRGREMKEQNTTSIDTNTVVELQRLILEREKIDSKIKQLLGMNKACTRKDKTQSRDTFRLLCGISS